MIAQDAKSAEIIRPILRGKDIKRYSYEFADKYLITTYNAYTDSEGNYIPSVDINDYPAVKVHLDNYSEQISKRQDKGDTPYNLRRCAYMDDFNKPKIVYQELTQGSRFALDENGEFILNNSGYLIVGENLRNLLTFLNSPAVEFAYKSFYSTNLGESGVRWLYNNIINLPIPKGIEATTEDDVNQIYGFTTEEMNFISSVVNSSRS